MADVSAQRPPEETRGAFTDWVIRIFDPWLESKKHSNLLIIGALLLVSIPIIGVGLATTRTILPRDWNQIVPAIAAIPAAIPATITAIPATPPASSPFSTPITALFTCSKGKAITAAFFDSSVELTLSDGRRLTLPHARSEGGARPAVSGGASYANPDESFVFWNAGDTAFIEENGIETYSKCVTNG